MSKACYNCPSNKSDCYRPHCVTGDGMKRTITTVNRMIPGPSIEVFKMLALISSLMLIYYYFINIAVLW